MTISIPVLIVLLSVAVSAGVVLCEAIHRSLDLAQLRREYQERELRTMAPPSPKKFDLGRIEMETDIRYMETTLKQLIEMLRQSSCIDQEFRFDTRKERKAHIEKLINEFLESDQCSSDDANL